MFNEPQSQKDQRSRSHSSVQICLCHTRSGELVVKVAAWTAATGEQTLYMTARCLPGLLDRELTELSLKLRASIPPQTGELNGPNA